MAFKPTPEQQKIIDARNTSLLVSAAAGSGKTAVLVERIVSLVCDEEEPVDIDRILVVTFTQAAAAEMKERVLKRISEKLEEDPENEHLLRQVTLVHRALITTIDSFCLDVIRNHFQDIGIDPDFRVADEGEARLIKADVLEKVLEDAYHSEDEDFLACVENFCPGNDDKVLEELILDLHNTAQSYPWPMEYLTERLGDHDIEKPEDLNGTELEKELKRSALGYIYYALAFTESAIRTCERSPVFDNYLETLSLDREIFEGLASVTINGSLSDLSAASCDAVNGKPTLKRIGKAADEEQAGARDQYSDHIKKLRDTAWKNIGNLYKKYFSFPIEEQVKQIALCKKPVNALIGLTIRFGECYAGEKRKRHVVDFPDLSHYALDILADHKMKNGGFDISPTNAAIEYRDRFAQVMVDEYQDSNLIQEVILSVISAEDIGRYDRFTVGDVKQSIYSFRQARPDLFLLKQDEYGAVPPKMEIDLSGNFRSRSEVIDSVNRVFERIMHEETGGIEYDEKAKLIAKAVYPENEGCKTELLYYDNKMIEDLAASLADGYNDGAGEGREESFDPADFMEDASDRSELEALVIASRIKELMKNGKVSDGNRDDPKLRDITYKDIVILSRSVSAVTETYRKVFADKGIPLYAEGKNGYFKTTEVSLLLQFLRVLSNPLDDVPLMAVLHSELGGFTEDEIALIRAGRQLVSLYDSLLMAAGRKTDICTKSAVDGILSQKVSDYLDRLDKYRDLSTYLTVRQLLDRITLEYDYLEMCMALPGGQSRIANVKMLLVMASDYENSSYLGINDFIRYIDNMEKFEVDSGEAGSASEGADVVRLMTIHKSKGLEFPVVFVAGMGKQFNFMDVSKPLLTDDAIGAGCRYADADKRIRLKTLRYSAISDKKRRDTIAEEMRLLYVAMTRACEKLILVGGMKDAEKTMDEFLEYPSEQLSLGYFQNAVRYFDLILPVIGCEEITDVVDIKNVNAESLYLEGKKEEESQAAGVSEFARLSSGDYSLADKDMLDLLRNKFSYEYPYSYLEKVYTKTTVSELKMAAMAEKDEGAYDLMEHGEDEISKPVFAGGSKDRLYDDPDDEAGEGDLNAPGKERSASSVTPASDISGTERGNAYHRIMQLLSWDRILMPVFEKVPSCYDEYKEAVLNNRSALIKSIESYVDEEMNLGHINQKTHDAVYTNKRGGNKIYDFLCSELSFRMWQADKKGLLKKEQPFVFGIPASEHPDLKKDHPDSEALDKETLLIQGIIDAYFFEDDKIILLDYKTDAVKDMDELWVRYETQMDYYKKALESLEGKAVTERHLYSFKLGEDRNFG